MVEQPPLDYFELKEKGHGRHSNWYVRVFDAQLSPKAKEWKNLRRMIHVHKVTQKNGKTSHSDRLYISDRFETNAEYFHKGIREHWGTVSYTHLTLPTIYSV